MGATAHPGQARGGISLADVLDRRGPPTDDAAARRTLRAQVARLERELAEAFVTTYPTGGLPQPATVVAAPRLLDLGELERVRDELTERLREAEVTISRRVDDQAQKRLALELMLLRPAEHRFERISCRELGAPGCGVWHVQPRLGLIGMLMGWWQVKLSSGCPLSGGHGPTPVAPWSVRRIADAPG